MSHIPRTADYENEVLAAKNTYTHTHVHTTQTHANTRTHEHAKTQIQTQTHTHKHKHTHMHTYTLTVAHAHTGTTRHTHTHAPEIKTTHPTHIIFLTQLESCGCVFPFPRQCLNFNTGIRMYRSTHNTHTHVTRTHDTHALCAYTSTCVCVSQFLFAFVNVFVSVCHSVGVCFFFEGRVLIEN